MSSSVTGMCQALKGMVNAQVVQLIASPDEKALIQGLVPQLEAETSSLPFFHLPAEQLSVQEKQLLGLKTLKVFLQGITSAAIFLGRDSSEMCSAIRHFLNVISISPVEDIVTSPQCLPYWMDEILSCQKIVKPFLAEASFNPEGSKGLTYKIKKEGKTCGYLFGTMHYLVTPEMRKAGNLSGIIFKRLVKCAVMGTEIAIRGETQGDSVEDKLMEVAKARGIANFGIDAEERKEVGNAKIDDSNVSDAEIEGHITQLVQSYIAGNVEQLKQLSHNPRLDPVIEKQRDAQMANNIDLFLKTAFVLGGTRGEAPFRSFFPLGVAHLLREGPGSISSILAERGWTLQLA